MIEFPIIDEADQSFSTILNNRRVTIRLRYNTTTDRWSFDLSIDDVPVLHGKRVVTGIDLLEPFNFDIGVLFSLPATGDTAVPDRTNLPTGVVRLYHAEEAELEALAAENEAVPS